MSGLSNELDQKNVFLLLYIYICLFLSHREEFLKCAIMMMMIIIKNKISFLFIFIHLNLDVIDQEVENETIINDDIDQVC